MQQPDMSSALSSLLAGWRPRIPEPGKTIRSQVIERVIEMSVRRTGTERCVPANCNISGQGPIKRGGSEARFLVSASPQSGF
jgi:hypothetical protein